MYGRAHKGLSDLELRSVGDVSTTDTNRAMNCPAQSSEPRATHTSNIVGDLSGVFRAVPIVVSKDHTG